MSSPRRPTASSPTRRQSGTPPRPPPKPSSPRRTQSYQPAYRGSGSPRPPATTRRHTTQMQSRMQRALPPIPSSPSRRRSTSPSPRGSGSQHVLIPVPIRAKDASSPVYIRAPSGQHVDFVFSPPKKRGIIGRLLDSVEWGEPEENKPYRYRQPSPKTASSNRPFYKRLLP